MKYRSVQFTPDGVNWIFDHEGDTIKEIWDFVSDQGSKWYFYPIPFVVSNKWGMDFATHKIIDAPNKLEHLKGKTISTAMRWIQDNPDFIEMLLS